MAQEKNQTAGHVEDQLIAALRQLQDGNSDRRLDAELRLVTDKLNSLQTELVLLSSKVVESQKFESQIAELKSSVKAISEETQKVSGRVPPLTQTGIVVTAVVGLLGFSVYDLRTSRHEIMNFKTPLEKASQEVQSTSNEAKTSIQGLTNNFAVLQQGVKSNLDGITSKVQDITSATTKLGETLQRASASLQSQDESIAKLGTEIALLSAQTGKMRLQSQPKLTNDDGITGLFEENALPKPFRLLLQAKRAYADGDFDTALELTRQAKVAANGEKTGIYDAFLGQVLFKLEKFKEAVGAFDAAIAKAPAGEDTSSERNNLGAAYFAWANQTSDKEEKHRLLIKSKDVEAAAVKLYPDRPGVRTNAATTLVTLKDFAGALQLLDEYHGEPTPDMLSCRACALVGLGRAIEAVELVAKAAAMDKHTALNMALDDDLAALRDNPDFISAIEQSIGSKAFGAVKLLWEKHSKKPATQLTS